VALGHGGGRQAQASVGTPARAWLAGTGVRLQQQVAPTPWAWQPLAAQQLACTAVLIGLLGSFGSFVCCHGMMRAASCRWAPAHLEALPAVLHSVVLIEVVLAAVAAYLELGAHLYGATGKSDNGGVVI
jgi:hypothetical protein